MRSLLLSKFPSLFCQFSMDFKPSLRFGTVFHNKLEKCPPNGWHLYGNIAINNGLQLSGWVMPYLRPVPHGPCFLPFTSTPTALLYHLNCNVLPPHTHTMPGTIVCYRCWELYFCRLTTLSTLNNIEFSIFTLIAMWGPRGLDVDVIAPLDMLALICCLISRAGPSIR